MAQAEDEREAARRAQILQGAARAFAHKGYHATTVKDIAAESGLAPGTLYLYFEGKRAILLGFLEYALDAAQTHVESLGAVPLEAALAQFLAERFSMLQQHAGIVRVLLAEAMFDEDLQAQLRQLLTVRVEGLISGLLEHYGGERLTRTQRLTVVRTMQAAVIGWGVLLPGIGAELPGDADESARHLASLLTRGIDDILKGAQQDG